MKLNKDKQSVGGQHCVDCQKQFRPPARNAVGRMKCPHCGALNRIRR